MPGLETNGLRTETFLERNDPREILITNEKMGIHFTYFHPIIFL